MVDDGPEAPGDGFRESAARFAEGATMLIAASVRMQMIMLEQARADLQAFTEALDGAAEQGDSMRGRDGRSAGRTE